LARHRSPSGAQADNPDRATPQRVVAVSSGHRLPAPPAVSVRGRAAADNPGRPGPPRVVPVPTERAAPPRVVPVPTERPAPPRVVPVPTERPAPPRIVPVPTERPAPPRIVPAPNGHRLPAPPAASLRHRATVAAVAAGAVVAAGQTLVSPFAGESLAPQAVGALVPVADVTHATEANPAVDAIGGDQLLPDPFTLGALDPASQVDVQNLAKAVDLGRELARQAAMIKAALAHGAPEAHLYGDFAFVRPTLGRLTSVFGSRWGVSHNGIDIAGPIGTPIYALTDGVVEEAGPASGFGLWVVLRHTDGSQSVYGHVNRMFVHVGEKVEAGEEIAEIGNRGYSTGPHLHFEIWDSGGTKINPIPWLRKRGIDF
jgi:murein DD-endopeptidase MepM/ murein hydrolase activator NlpD